MTSSNFCFPKTFPVFLINKHANIGFCNKKNFEKKNRKKTQKITVQEKIMQKNERQFF